MAVRLGLPDYRSSVTSNFVKEGVLKIPPGRVDGRTSLQSRTPIFTLERDFSAGNAGFITSSASAMVHLGDTKALAVVVGEVVTPFPDRPAEGRLHFSVEVSPMAEAGGTGRNTAAGNLAVEIARVIERGIRDSQALDTESLCIFSGERVWAIKVDIRVLDLCGNAMDAAGLAAIAALHHYRRPEIKADGDGNIVVIPEWDSQPEPLALHHAPICVSFALFAKVGEQQERFVAYMDPILEEEAVMGGSITYCLTPHAELCTLQKNGGVAISASELVELANIASKRVAVIYSIMSEALRLADTAYRRAVDERLRSLQGGQDLSRVLCTTPPLKVDAGARGLAHLDYNDLHITGQLREEDLGEQNVIFKQQQISPVPISPLQSQSLATSKEDVLVSEQQRNVRFQDENHGTSMRTEEEEQDESLVTFLHSEFPSLTATQQVPSLSNTTALPLSGPVLDNDVDDLTTAVKQKKNRRKKSISRKK